MSAHSTLLVAVAALAVLSSNVRADVLVVDASGGGDFTAVAAAVAAAEEGDTLVVMPGTYGALHVVAKSLNVVAAPGAEVRVANVCVTDLAADQRVIVSGLDASVPPTLFVRGSAGAVWAQNCELIDTSTMNPYHAAEAHTSDNVVIQHCSLRGGTAALDSDGGHGLLLFGESRVSAWSSTFLSGDGGNQALSNSAGNGGHGVHVKTGVFYGMGCELVGALGGQGAPDGDDGPGAVVAGPATARMTDVSLSGAGAAPDQIGSIAMLGAAARELRADPVALAGTTALWTLAGEPGDRVTLLRSLEPDARYVAGAAGVLAVRPPLAIAPPVGTIGQAGELTIPVAISTLPRGVEARTLFVQPLFVSGAGERVLGNPVAVEILAARP